MNTIESLFKTDENHMQIWPEFFVLLYDYAYQFEIFEIKGSFVRSRIVFAIIFEQQLEQGHHANYHIPASYLF